MSKASGGGCAAVLILGLCLGAGILDFAYNHYNEHVATCTITGKDRSRNHETGSSEYRVYTKDCGTLSNKDAFLRTKYNSGDIQGQLVEQHAYRIRVVGWRLPYWSTFPNILAVEGEVVVSEL